jgi:hypothetical protein
MTTPSITSQDLYAQLVSEFERIRPAECRTCKVPRPFSGPAAGNGSLYWYMEPASVCPHGCRQRIAQMWAKATTEYHITAPSPAEMA